DTSARCSYSELWQWEKTCSLKGGVQPVCNIYGEWECNLKPNFFQVAAENHGIKWGEGLTKEKLDFYTKDSYHILWWNIQRLLAFYKKPKDNGETTDWEKSQCQMANLNFNLR